MHEALTEDGYIITLHRIVNPYTTSGQLDGGGTGRPVILAHGLLASAAVWITQNLGGHVTTDLTNMTMADNMLGFDLARRGYDVWLMNSRGNTYSQKHIQINPKCKSDVVISQKSLS